MLNRLTYANVIATLALVLAVGTGSSYAVSKIDGSAVKTRTLSGKKMKKNTLTGKEIREDKLKAVPSAVSAGTALKAADADKLGGQTAGSYVQGNVSVTMGRATLTAPSGERILETPVGRFRLRCQAATADVRYHNTTGAAADLWRTGVRAAGATNGLFGTLAPGADAGLAYPVPMYSVLRAEQGERVVELSANSDKIGASTCRFAWKLTVQA
jgi:hypothetical protein